VVTVKRHSSLAKKNAPSSWWDCPTCYHYGLIALLEVRFVVRLSRSVGRYGVGMCRVGRRGMGVPWSVAWSQDTAFHSILQVSFSRIDQSDCRV